ncbi:MAG: hypothetical protein OXQ28_05205 [Acidobacteriota bacterium]|nr:hypothetical protein [Acidobacteriota bacterium]
MNDHARKDGVPGGTHADSVYDTLKTLRTAISDKEKYAREWCTERSDTTLLEGERRCLCSRLFGLDVDSDLKWKTFVTLLAYTSYEPHRSECARLHMVAPNHTAALQLVDRALNDHAGDRAR